MPTLALVVLIVVIGLLVMIPTRRLFLAGWTPPALTAYFLGVLALGLLVAELRGPARYLIPVLVLAYIAPFITARDGVARLRGRFGGGPPRSTRPPDAGSGPSETRRSEPRNVTPKEAQPPDARS